MKGVIYIAIDESLFGERFKIYKSIEEAKKDETFLYDKLYRCEEVKRHEEIS